MTQSINSSNKNAPVVVFAFARLECLKRLMNSLENNDSVSETDLYIFVDKANENENSKKNLNGAVIEWAKKYQTESIFRKVIVKVANSPQGLANSIIHGVTEIINRYGKVIVLEDDLVVSQDFLRYMNCALNFYEGNSRVWSISGWSLTPERKSYFGKMTYLFPRGNSWGWGMWKNRWNSIDWNCSCYNRFNLLRRWKFNMGGNDLSNMLVLQMKNPEFNSWAIRWDFNASVYGKKTLYPRQSRVIHDDRTGEGTHCKEEVVQQGLRQEYTPIIFDNRVKCGFESWWDGYWYYSTSVPRRVASDLIRLGRKIIYH